MERVCDDGNLIDDDGCNAQCLVETGWTCSGGTATSADTCVDHRPITYNVSSASEGQLFYNEEANEVLQLAIHFIKTFNLPSGKTLKDFIVLEVEDYPSAKLSVEIVPDASNPRLYYARVRPASTIKYR